MPSTRAAPATPHAAAAGPRRCRLGASEQPSAAAPPPPTPLQDWASVLPAMQRQVYLYQKTCGYSASDFYQWEAVGPL